MQQNPRQDPAFKGSAYVAHIAHELILRELELLLLCPAQHAVAQAAHEIPVAPEDVLLEDCLRLFRQLLLNNACLTTEVELVVASSLINTGLHVISLGCP